MPGEFDTNCKELCLKKMSVEAFKKEVVRLSVKIRNTAYDVDADYNFHRHDFSVWEGILDERRAAFWSDHKKEYLRSVEALKQGPKGRDPESMLKWVRQFPYVLAYPNFLEKEKIEYNKDYLDLATAWTDLFSDEEDVETIYEGQTGIGHDVEKSKSKLDAFCDKADELFGPAQEMEEEEAELDRLVEQLEDASMFTDSGEYRNLISMTKMLNKTERVPHMENLGYEQHQALKLAMIKTCVDAYLDHKARDGVKRNVYHKLAAVEELNRYVCKRMETVGTQNIPDEKMRDGLFFPETVEDESSILEIKSPKTYSTEEIEAKVERANSTDSGDPTTVNECARTLDCMARILMRAEHLKVPDTQIQELTAVREQFFRNPGRGPGEAVDEIAEDNPTKDLPQAY